jgi:benzodiazapine receptor
MQQDKLRQFVVVLALVATVAVNGLANALLLNGQTTGDIADRFQVYFVPAGYVFSIWSLIYLGLTAFAIYQALPAQRTNPRLRRIRPTFVLSCVANIVWLFLWHYEQFLLTMAAMLTLLLALIVIYNQLRIGVLAVPRAEKWFVHTPFSVYLGWITVATIANATVVLDYVNWSGWGIPAEGWTAVMLLVGVALAAAVKLTRGDNAFVLVLVWAFAGIAVKHAGTPAVSIAAFIATVLVALLLLLSSRHTNRFVRLGMPADS